jgi:hypothetical protein
MAAQKSGNSFFHSNKKPPGSYRGAFVFKGAKGLKTKKEKLPPREFLNISEKFFYFFEGYFHKS